MVKSIHEILSKEYPYRIELHAHTYPASDCGKASPEELVALYLEAGFDGVVITNHYCLNDFTGLSRAKGVEMHLSDYQRACKAAQGTRLKIYLGTEIRFEENGNDYLLYGVDREILDKLYDYFGKGLASFRQELSLPNSVLVQAHPFRDKCVPADGKYLDGIEVFNMHPNHNPRAALASLYAQEQGLTLTTAGTDFHHVKPGYIAAAALRCRELPADSFALAQLLRSEDYFYEIGNKFVL